MILKADIDKYVPIFANNPSKTLLRGSGYDGFSVTAQSEDRNDSRSFNRRNLIQRICS